MLAVVYGVMSICKFPLKQWISTLLLQCSCCVLREKNAVAINPAAVRHSESVLVTWSFGAEAFWIKIAFNIKCVRWKKVIGHFSYLDAFQEHTKEELDSWKIVRVSEDFRVIALGLPVPKYKGNPLDPPLRSRFQARDVYYLPFKVNPQIYGLLKRK